MWFGLVWCSVVGFFDYSGYKPRIAHMICRIVSYSGGCLLALVSLRHKVFYFELSSMHLFCLFPVLWVLNPRNHCPIQRRETFILFSSKNNTV